MKFWREQNFFFALQIIYIVYLDGLLYKIFWVTVRRQESAS